MKKFVPEGRLIETPENKAALSSCSSLSRAMAERRILEAKAVICDGRHNLIVDLGCMKGIIRREEGARGIAEGKVRDIAVISRVGKPVCFYVESISSDINGVPYAMLSRRAVQEDCVRNYISRLSSGDIIDATVTHLEPFGAFVDIGCGMPSMISIDLISVSRISHPRDRLSVGMEIRAIVKENEGEGRVVLSHRELLGTWSENAAMFNVGETVTGVIRSIEEYGIFVEIAPNLAGLAECRDGVSIGQYASVYIKSIIPERMKVKLVLVDTFRAEISPEKPRYFFEGDHIETFCYSPKECERVIETVF